MAKTKTIRDSKWYAMIGRAGGRVKGVSKGFAANPDKASLAGRLGGAIGRIGQHNKLSKRQKDEVKKSLDDIVQSLNSKHD